MPKQRITPSNLPSPISSSPILPSLIHFPSNPSIFNPSLSSPCKSFSRQSPQGYPYVNGPPPRMNSVIVLIPVCIAENRTLAVLVVSFVNTPRCHCGQWACRDNLPQSTSGFYSTPHPLTRRQVLPPPPLVPGGGNTPHSLAGEGVCCPNTMVH